LVIFVIFVIFDSAGTQMATTGYHIMCRHFVAVGKSQAHLMTQEGNLVAQLLTLALTNHANNPSCHS